MTINKILIFCFFATVAINGCRCKKSEPEPAVIQLNAFEYFPDNNNKQWIYEVYKVNYTVKPSISAYAYDDTLSYVKDTNITDNKMYPTNFKFYDFRKKHEFNSFTVGKYPDTGERLLIYSDQISLTLYDLNNITNDGPYQKFKSDGLPINNKVSSYYFTPFENNYQTSIGNFKAITSNTSYLFSNSGLYLRYNHYYKFAENIGPVNLFFDYEYRNPSLNIDSFYTVEYRIKKVIN